MRHGLDRRSGWCACLLVGVAGVLPANSETTSFNRKVTAQGAALLSEAVPDLGRQGGVPLFCGERLGGRRFFLYARSRPLTEVLGQIQQTARNAPGKVLLGKYGSGWLLEEDLACREGRARSAEKALQAREAQARRDLAAAEEHAKPRPGERSALEGDRKQAAGFLRVFRGLSPAQQKTALRGGVVAAGYDSLSPRGQAILRDRVRNEGNSSRRPDGTLVDQFDGRRDYRRTVVYLSPGGTREKPGIRMLLGLRPGVGLHRPDILHPPKLVDTEGFVYEEQKPSLRLHGPEGMEELPGLQRRITLEGGYDWWVERALQEFSQEAGVPVIGEYDPCYTRPGWYPPQRQVLRPGLTKELPAWKALEVLCRHFDLDWEYQGGWVRIRSPRLVQVWAGQMDLSPPAAR